MSERGWYYSGAYLEQFPESYRGTISDRFCRAIRAGCEDVDAMLEWIADDLAGNDGTVWQDVARTVIAGEANVWDFATHMLWRENLPSSEKIRLKNAARGDGSRKHMAHLDPTPKQLEYLRALHCPITPTSRLDASELIERFKASKSCVPPPTDIDYNDLPF